MLDFHALKRPASPNTYLIAPQGFAGPPPDEPAPEFRLAAPALYELARRIALSQARTTLLEDAPQILAFEVRQRTWFWQFPDHITIAALPLGDSRASLALYSRSRYGYGDFGVNRRRAQRWLGQIAGAATPIRS
ncbi:MAG: DUF1499 domain-containing protein [Alphaproteobacteria bacterium]|nr:DUF1499 domain-containing protein [Alphaproteobacteria bacterium]